MRSHTPPYHIVMCALLVIGSAPSVAAQDGFMLHSPSAQVTLRAGAAQPLARDALFDEFRSRFTLDRSDLLALSGGADVAIFAGQHFDVLLGVAISRSRTRSEYRDFIGSDGLPINQTTSLLIVPVTAGLRYQFFDRGRSIGSNAWIPRTFAPYVGFAIGATWFQLRQEGEFVDFTDNSIYGSNMVNSGTSLGGHVLAGFDRWFTPIIGFNAEARYSWASASPENAWQAYDSIDLSGVQLGIGISLRP